MPPPASPCLCQGCNPPHPRSRFPLRFSPSYPYLGQEFVNPCHRHLAVPLFIVEPSGVSLACKLVEIVRHAAELAYISYVFFRQPFPHVTVSVTFSHILARRYARLIRLCQQTEVVGCRHLYANAIAQLFCRFLFRATALVTFLIFHILIIQCCY